MKCRYIMSSQVAIMYESFWKWLVYVSLRSCLDIIQKHSQDIQPKNFILMHYILLHLHIIPPTQLSDVRANST